MYFRGFVFVGDGLREEGSRENVIRGNGLRENGLGHGEMYPIPNSRQRMDFSFSLKITFKSIYKS
jgi:hypothetical protein